MLHMRDQLLTAVKAHAQGEIAKHRANVEVYLEPVSYTHLTLPTKRIV